MQFNNKKIFIQIFAIIGFILSIKLAHIYYVANYERYALASFCSINEFIDCDGAARSTMSQFWGIPLAYWGIFLYITVFFLTLVEKLKTIRFLTFLEVFKQPMAYITVLGTIAFTISMILAGMSVYKLNKICIVCFVTYFIDLIIALIASSANIKNLITAFKTTVLDFINGAKKYPKTFVSLLIITTSFLCYSGITNNFIPHYKRHVELVKYQKMSVNPYKINGNTLGKEDANVVIELYSDYICPLCYIHNIMLHKAAKEFKNIKIIHYNLPFDKECNPYISINMHPGACLMARAAIASKKQGNYWGMGSLLYEKQPQNIDKILELAEELKLDKDKLLLDINSDSTKEELSNNINKGHSLNIDGTPTIYINGKKKVGVMPYYKLKELLIENGAKK